MTDREALELTSEIWGWLAANPESEKKDWPGFGGIRYMENNCPLCEKAVEKIGAEDFCGACLLKDLWPKDSMGDSLCFNGGLWSQWAPEKDLKARGAIAREIANLCREKLKQLRFIELRGKEGEKWK